MQNLKTVLIVIIAIIFFIISFRGCNENKESNQYARQSTTTYTKSPLDLLIRDLNSEQNFTIILYDMDYNESSDTYLHKYNVLVERPDSVYTKETDWVTVSRTFFNQNVDNMGMELASKKDGNLNKTAAPAGYSNYIGNEKYGQWRERDGSSFWEFYGRYAFMSSMFRMAMFPIQYSYWNDYRTNYYGNGRSYYGPTTNGQRMYGTNSRYGQTNTQKTWNNKSSSFKSRVRSQVSRSSSASNTRSARTTRSSNRYSSSSTRSRGGGFGK